MTEPSLKPVIWVGSSLKGLADISRAGSGSCRLRPHVAQRGGKRRDTKPLRGFGGAGVVEVIKDFHGDTFRAVYVVRYAEAVYVLHAFQKKSKTGRDTSRNDLQLIEQRLREAEKNRREEGL